MPPYRFKWYCAPMTLKYKFTVRLGIGSATESVLVLVLLPVSCALRPLPRQRRKDEGRATLLPRWMSEHVYAYNTFAVSANRIVAFFCVRLPPHISTRDTNEQAFHGDKLVAVVTSRFVVFKIKGRLLAVRVRSGRKTGGSSHAMHARYSMLRTQGSYRLHPWC